MKNNEIKIRMEYLSSDSFRNSDGIFTRAFWVSERLLKSGNLLQDGEILGWKIELSNEKAPANYLFTNQERKISTEDYNWIFKDYAEIIPGKSIVSNESFRDNRKCYELVSAKCVSDNEGQRRYRLSVDDIFDDYYDEVYESPYFEEMCSELNILGAWIYVIFSANNPETIRTRRVIFSFRESLSLRVKSLISLTFPEMILKEYDEEISDDEQLPDEQLKSSIIKLLRFLENDYSESIRVGSHRFSEEDVELIELDKKDETRTMKTIDDLDLSIRSYNSLKQAGVTTIEQLRKMSDEDLRKVRNLGEKSFAEIKQKLEEIQEQESQTQKAQLNGISYTAMLENLVGLDAAKKQVKQIAAFARMQMAMREQGRASPSISLNMDFIGNPGTAKTTVARIMAGIFNEIGLLSSNELVEVGRADLVAKYVGQTAIKVKEVFEKAKGKVLFIDEAYSLVDYWENAYGDEAITTIVQEMENRRDETIVIFAGYPDKMNDFFSRNPGLRSRVPFTIQFCDYSGQELFEICNLEAEKSGFIIGSNAKEKLREICDKAVGNKAMGNGRFCRNLIENAILRFASRVYGGDTESGVHDYTLVEDDFESNLIPLQKKTLSIGF